VIASVGFGARMQVAVVVMFSTFVTTGAAAQQLRSTPISQKSLCVRLSFKSHRVWMRRISLTNLHVASTTI